MTLRDPLVSFQDDEPPDTYMRRALAAAEETGGPYPRLRIEVGRAITLGDGTSHCSASLWVERGKGRTESWQRVTGSVLAESYADALTLFSKALDASAKTSPDRE